jgi:hypothetical protein
MTRPKSQANKKSSSSNKIIPRLVRIGGKWQRKEIKEVIKNGPKRLVRNGNIWKRIVPETVSPQQNLIPNRSLKRMFGI